MLPLLTQAYTQRKAEMTEVDCTALLEWLVADELPDPAVRDAAQRVWPGASGNGDGAL